MSYSTRTVEVVSVKMVVPYTIQHTGFIVPGKVETHISTVGEHSRPCIQSCNEGFHRIRRRPWTSLYNRQYEGLISYTGNETTYRTIRGVENLRILKRFHCRVLRHLKLRGGDLMDTI